MTTKVIELKDMDGNILLPHAYSASHDNNGDAFSSVYATITTVNTKADDNAVVHLLGNEVITGVKTINVPTAGTNLIFKSNLIDTSATPEENIYQHIDYRDKNDNLLARIFECRDIYGANVLALQAWNGSTQHWIGVNSSGYGVAPTPSDASDNSTKIATTAWVNSHIDVNPNVVRTTGSQSVNGKKIFSGDGVPIVIKSLNGLFEDTKHSAYLQFQDSNEKVVGWLESAINQEISTAVSGAVTTRLWAKTYTDNTYANEVNCNFDLVAKPDGTTYMAFKNQEIKAFIKETYVSGTSWYRIWSDGWIEQGGSSQVNDDQTITLTFLKSFSNTNYIVSGCTKNSNNASNYGLPGFINKTTTTIQVNGISNGISPVYFDWRACGY